MDASSELHHKIQTDIMFIVDRMISDIALTREFGEIDAEILAQHIVGAVFTLPITVGTVTENLKAKRALAAQLPAMYSYHPKVD